MAGGKMVRTDDSPSPTRPTSSAPVRRTARAEDRAGREVPLRLQSVPDHGAAASPRMFKSSFVDAFSRVPFWVVPLVYLPVVALSCYAAVAWEGLGMVGLVSAFGLGWVTWSLMEYWLHRTLFHWTPDAPWGEQFHFVLHGVHHDWYRDRLRLVMPPAFSLVVGVLVFTLLTAIGMALAPLLDSAWVPALFAGIVFGYLVYDMIHYYVHHGKPRSALLKALRAHHSKHHHNPRYHDKKFGVSMTVWDHVFGTYE